LIVRRPLTFIRMRFTLASSLGTQQRSHREFGMKL
jgi:hypothetical protein